MGEHLPSWLSDLQSMLPADPSRRLPDVSEEQLVTHLARAGLAVVGAWTAGRSRTKHSRASHDLSEEWLVCEALLSAIRTRCTGSDGGLEAGVEGRDRLLKEARRLES